MSIKGLGNSTSGYRDRFGRSGANATPLAPTLSPISASGGNQTDANGFTSGGYKYHVFTSSGSLTVNSGNDNIEFLVVAGGGGGGWSNGGGGGAGGLRTNDPGVPSTIRITDTVTLSPGPYTITVGDGGNSGPTTAQADRAGDDSSIGSLVVASGGGGGGPAAPPTAMDGGSGGGQQGSAAGDSIASPDGLTPAVQGSAGGTRDGGGGGGGASQVDGPIDEVAPYPPSSGAAGLDCPVFTSPIIHPGCPMPADWQTYVGSNGRYAAGGWGYPDRDSSWNPSTYEGIANTGGGADSNETGATTGGKGIVIIRYST